MVSETIMLDSAKRMILATFAEGLPAAFAKGCFHLLDERETFEALHQAGLWIGPRAMLEDLPIYRQIIPYVVLRSGDQIVRYRRMQSGSESRLHGRTSIGLGGHIDLSDIVVVGDSVNLGATLNRSAEREVSEELGVTDCRSRKWIGMLVDNSTAVSRVHIGVVEIWDWPSPTLGRIEEALGEVALCSIDELEHVSNTLEVWSAMLLPYLRNSVAGVQAA